MFITFEGPDGSGKTTQIELLADYFNQQGYSMLVTREPGGTSIGEQIRDVLLKLDNTEMHPRTEILLLQASRAQLVEQVIRPQLEKEKIILCDRYADSTMAYQGYGHGVSLEKLQALIDFATDGLQPDLTLLLDLDVEEGLRRRAEGGQWNRLDAYERAFHERVRQGYLKLARAEPQRWSVIDAGQATDAVQTDIQQVVIKRLKADNDW